MKELYASKFRSEESTICAQLNVWKKKNKVNPSIKIKQETFIMYHVNCNLIASVNSFAISYINAHVNQERYGRRELATYEDNYKLHHHCNYIFT